MTILNIRVVLINAVLALTCGTHGQNVVDHGTLRKLDVSAEQMRSFIYPLKTFLGGLDPILGANVDPSVPPYPSVPGPVHINLNVGGDSRTGTISSRAEYFWKSENASMRIEVRCYDTPQNAHHRLSENLKYVAAKFDSGTPSGARLGDESYFIREPGRVVTFRRGRLLVSVNAGAAISDGLLVPWQAPPGIFQEAVARSHEYSYLARMLPSSRPAIRVNGRTAENRADAVNIDGTIYVGTALIARADTRLRRVLEGPEIRLSGRGSIVRMRPFRQEIEVNGRPARLDVPVMYWDGELIVPVRPVANALGVRVSYANGVLELN